MLSQGLKRESGKIKEIPINNIRSNPYQPRKYFDMTSLRELAASIKEYGVMQPVSVRLINGSYELVSGERRLRAAKIAELKTIPCIIINVSDNDSAFMALIENLQRQNLNFIEEAEGYQNLVSDYGLTQEEIAAKVGKSQSSVANKMRILKLSPYVKKLLLENNLTERHARALLKIPDDVTQKYILYKIIDNDLNVKKTEELVEETLERIRQEGISKEEQKIKRNFNDIRLFTNTIKQTVDIMKQSGIRATYSISDVDKKYEILIKIPYGK